MFPLILLTSAWPSSFENMSQLINSCPAWKRLEQLSLMLPLPSFAFTEVHLLCLPQRPMYIGALHSALLWPCASDHAWYQARPSRSRGGLGLHSLAQHSPAAYIALLCTSGFGCQSQYHHASAVQLFNLLYHHRRQLTQRHFC